MQSGLRSNSRVQLANASHPKGGSERPPTDASDSVTRVRRTSHLLFDMSGSKGSVRQWRTAVCSPCFSACEAEDGGALRSASACAARSAAASQLQRFAVPDGHSAPSLTDEPHTHGKRNAATTGHAGGRRLDTAASNERTQASLGEKSRRSCSAKKAQKSKTRAAHARKGRFAGKLKERIELVCY
jgi:hypothetical protein